MRNLLILIKTVVATAVIGAFMLYSNDALILDFEPDRETMQLSMEEAPIISHEAIRAYEKGIISRSVAMERIEERLDKLVSAAAIQGWVYEGDAYNVIMSNGTIFSYNF